MVCQGERTGGVLVGTLSLITMCDAAVVVRQIKRRAAARRVAQLVQSGAVFADDYRALTATEPDVVVAAALALALRARSLRKVVRRDNTVRGIIELDGDSELWAAKAGPVDSDGHRFADHRCAVEWLERAVHNHLQGSHHESDYYLQIGIVEGQIACRSALEHNEAGWCDVCWAVEQAWRSEPVARRAATELTDNCRDNAERVGETWGSWYSER